MEIMHINGIDLYDPNDKEKFKLVEETLPSGNTVEVIYRKGEGGKTLEEMEAMHARQNPGFSYIAPINHRTYEAAENIICMQDECCTFRDGVKMYADIFLPSDRKGPFPLIMSWGPFGKRASEGVGGSGEWKLMGVPPQTVSKLAKFESADPSYWCRQGYAVANCDPRGVGNSEGDVSNWGPQDAKDGYDFIEWAAEQEWCNGKVAMFGNSGVCMVIWRIAAEQPPHLAAIGAWEGTGDMYRESFACGGIVGAGYNERMMHSIGCKTWIEDGPNMLAAHPYIDEYWESRIPKWKNIKVPAYICSGLCHIHNRGSFEAFRRIRSQKKWMRAHRNMEWPDTYDKENLEDLTKFFDRYLKDVRNGWEFTPRVRVDVMDAYDYDFRSKRPETKFPLERTEYRKLYMDAATHSMSYEQFLAHSEVSYDPETETTTFDFTVDEETEITGYISARFYVECRGHDNMDLFLWVKKLNAEGKYIPIDCMGGDYRGAWAYCRCTHRELDPEWSSDFQPVQAHRKREPMEQGQIYPVDIEFYPHSRIWHKGETLRLEVQGRFIYTDWFEDSHMVFDTDNGERKHVIHTGGEYGSYLQIPFIPPKYKSGDYEYR